MTNGPKYVIKRDGCVFNVGEWMDPAHKRMAITCEVLDDERTARDIAHLLAWRFENPGASIADALPVNGAAERKARVPLAERKHDE